MPDLRHSAKKIKKKLLCRVPNSRHSAKKDVAEHRYAGQPMPSAALLPRAWHSTNKSFAECLFLPSARHSAKNSLPSAIFCWVRHSAKKVFAECLIFDTRQSNFHSAKTLFPVVAVRGGVRLVLDDGVQLQAALWMPKENKTDLFNCQ